MIHRPLFHNLAILKQEADHQYHGKLCLTESSLLHLRIGKDAIRRYIMRLVINYLLADNARHRKDHRAVLLELNGPGSRSVLQYTTLAVSWGLRDGLAALACVFSVSMNSTAFGEITNRNTNDIIKFKYDNFKFKTICCTLQCTTY